MFPCMCILLFLCVTGQLRASGAIEFLSEARVALSLLYSHNQLYSPWTPRLQKETTEMAPKAAASEKPAHPKYEVMVADAIASLKERTGSSNQAITKFVEGKYKGLPDNWKKLMSVQVKRLVDSGKLVKVLRSPCFDICEDDPPARQIRRMFRDLWLLPRRRPASGGCASLTRHLLSFRLVLAALIPCPLTTACQFCQPSNLRGLLPPGVSLWPSREFGSAAANLQRLCQAKPAAANATRRGGYLDFC